eukprot:TRINITY_DN3809_c0_g2_i7.p1 TRINITY_DN3809_c0_g2~~TRINITY_DN3809_c0_g2_i7.p1  ORF type:complete len:182 (+),score=32.75 TRINITY_DN3809_c0_g2_i7:87-632(+)
MVEEKVNPDVASLVGFSVLIGLGVLSLFTLQWRSFFFWWRVARSKDARLPVEKYGIPRMLRASIEKEFARCHVRVHPPPLKDGDVIGWGRVEGSINERPTHFKSSIVKAADDFAEAASRRNPLLRRNSFESFRDFFLRVARSVGFPQSESEEKFLVIYEYARFSSKVECALFTPSFPLQIV